MMTKAKHLRAAIFFAGLMGLGMGCELIAGVDRGKLDNTGGEAGATTGGGGTGATGGATGATAGTGGTGGTGGATCMPVDDNNECTDDICDADNMPAHVNKMAGEACTTGGSMCDGMGNCVECLGPTDCPGEDNACQTRTCDQGVCGFDFVAADTPIPTQTVGDCKVVVCDGAGAEVDNNDDLDVNDDSNDCTDDVCTNGTPTNPAKAADTACGMGGALFCDGGGLCVGCNTADQCTGTDDECKVRTCVNKICGVDFTAANTPVADQTAQNCLQNVCDGNGNITQIADDADHPADDGNQCTDDTCASGAEIHPAKTNGTACNDGDACSQTDTCQSAACTGGNPVVCSAQDQCHDAGTCNPADGTCSNPAKADGAACNDNNACTQTDTCTAGACGGGNPVVCTASDQCHDVGTCNMATGMCSNPAKADGATCSDGDACTQTDTCTAGACTGANPVTCTASDQCHDAGTCNPANGTCSNPAKADGVTCNDGNACTQTDTCQAGACSGANPVTCMALDQCHVAGTCDSGTGMCSNPNAANGTVCVSAGINGTCQTGACAACGDNTKVAAEACDDGNLVGNDGCSAKCAIEAPYACTGSPSVCTSAKEINCNDGKDNDGDGQMDCADTDCALHCNVNVGACGAGEVALVYTATDTPLAIPDSNVTGVTSNITVGGLGKIKRVVAQTNITHTFDADIDATLKSPGNVSTDVTSDNGSTDNDYTDTIFNQSCATSITSGTAPFTGCFRPEASFNVYNGGQAKGTWAWTTVDDLGGDTGTVNTYRLALCVTNTTCGDAVVDPGETCDDGNAINGDACDISCKPPGCGNGALSGAETCDDGNTNNGDGCSSTCTLETGFSCTGQPSVCAVVCGDGIVGPGETCDDGNTANGDCCSSTCQIEAGCELEPNNTPATATAMTLVAGAASLKGNIPVATDVDYYKVTLTQVGAIKAQTFDGTGANTCVGASQDTKIFLYAPDGTTELANNDQGGISPCSLIDPATTAAARNLAAGTYYIKVQHWSLGAAIPVYRLAVNVFSCGDGTKETYEGCDDTNNTNGDGCTSACVVELGYTCTGSPSVCTLSCGNGVINGTDQCDDNNTTAGDGCSSLCQIEPGYTCTGTPSTCTFTCGNGTVTGNEQCDDGGVAAGDGCSPTCQAEAGWACAGFSPNACAPICGNGGTIIAPETCDDGNTSSGDTCDSGCATQTNLTEVEPNDTTAGADTAATNNGILVTSTAMIAGAITPAGDKDLYKVVLAADSVVRFETFDSSGNDCTAANIPASMKLSVLNSAGTSIYSDTSTRGIGLCSAVTAFLTAGTYYAQVERSASGTITAYKLEVKVQTSTGNESEVNDTRAASDGFVGSNIYVFGGHQVNSDLDVFAINVPAGKSLRIETIEGSGAETCESNGIDSRVRLLNADGSERGSVDDSGRGFCTLIDGTGASAVNSFAKGLAGGVYYLQVEASDPAGAGDAQFDYRLVVTIR